MEHSEPQSEVNPWISIWFNPRRTIRQIVDTNPTQHVILLAALSGIFSFLDSAANRTMGDSFSIVVILILSITVGPLGGIFGLYVGALLFRWTGSLLGGQASSEQVRAAIAWGSMPDVLMLIIFVPIIAVFGRDWFSSSPEWVNQSYALVLLSIIGLIGLTLLIWKMFLLVKCLAEVHEFSAWKSLAASIIGLLVVIVPIFLLVFGCSFLAS